MTPLDRPAIVITGAALITPLGATREQTWQNILANKCGIAPYTELETTSPDLKTGGQAVPLPQDFEPTLPRESRYLRRALLDALTDAAIPITPSSARGAGDPPASSSLPYAPQHCGLLLGTTLHGMREGGQFLRTNNFDHLKNFPANAVLARAAADLPLAGLAATTCSACSSSLGAIALACTLLETGQLDLVVAGGYDPISDYAYAGFNSLRLVSPSRLRPFARDREGMKVSEGYGIVVLERATDAAKRHAKPLAQIRGYGESADAHHLTQPHPEGDGAARAVQAALASAGLSPADIDLIAAHATGTPDNDAGEYAAFTRTFGDDLKRVPVVAFKSHLGHTLGGAGAIELILSALSLRDQTIPACANVTASDTDFPNLNLSTGASRRSAIRATLNTSLGFGGANTCVILTPPPPSSPSVLSVSSVVSPSPRDVFITGIGVILPNIIGLDALKAAVQHPTKPAWESPSAPIDESLYLPLLSARRVRRMSPYVRMTLAATALALQDASITDPTAFAETCSAILGSAQGSSNYCHQYYTDIVKQGLIGANPMLFAEGVPNAAAAHLSLMLSLKGACQTLLGSRTAGLDAIRLASLRISTGEWNRAIVGAGEEFYDLVNDAYRHCRLHTTGPTGAPPFTTESGFVAGAGAITLILESRDSLEKRGATIQPRAKILSAASMRAPAPADVTLRTADLLKSLGHPTAILSSANATWVDRSELAAIRSACPGASVSTIYGHTPELFTVTPLAALAATLATGHLPPNLAPLPEDFRAPSADQPVDTFATLATDYTGLVTGLLVTRT